MPLALASALVGTRRHEWGVVQPAALFLFSRTRGSKPVGFHQGLDVFLAVHSPSCTALMRH